MLSEGNDPSAVGLEVPGPSIGESGEVRPARLHAGRTSETRVGDDPTRS